MKLCRFEKEGNIFYGILEGDEISFLAGEPYDGLRTTGEHAGLGEVKLLAPTVPKSIVAVGLNYRKHAEEIGMPLVPEPLIFSKFVSSVINPFEQIVKPDVCKQLDYEAELAIVIGRRCCKVKKEEARDYILGYTCMNDVTARDLQDMTKQWARCKGFDTFSPFGPWVETEVDGDNLHLQAVLNGKVVQDDTTADFIFSTAELVEYISGFMTLYPGDIITTGTPGGIGPMKSGDEIKVVIEGIGELVNYVK
ncbi:fumarylacetoacetate hydrolase family protein [Christensenella massiliensis]|uniref:Fumarylacetoacetate hydrolase family protein n=1 Tax=Christensenella massiliensis TaxID=1805714 RepID=A0AAU8A792_9FIRM